MESVSDASVWAIGLASFGLLLLMHMTGGRGEKPCFLCYPGHVCFYHRAFHVPGKWS